MTWSWDLFFWFWDLFFTGLKRGPFGVEKASKVMKIGAVSGPKGPTKGTRFGVVFEAKRGGRNPRNLGF